MSNKVPQIRFNGYSDDWEERKLGDAVNISSGVTGDATLQNGKYRLTRIESISQGMLNVARLGFTNEKPDQQYLLNVGDILYSNINSLSHIGKVALVDTTGIYHGINLLRFQMRNGVDSEFLFQRLNTMPMKNWAVSHANPAVSQASINQTELSKQPILSPTLTEQQQIGSFFKEIDNTIALHQRKLDLLKEQKKGFLQKMFPKNGAKVPELRFAGFADDWEERKLSDMANVKTGFPFKNENFVDDGQYLVITNGNIQNDSAFVDGKVGNRITAVTDEIKEKYTLNDGDILVTMDGTVGRTAKVVEGNQILAQRVGRLVSESTPEFIYQWLNTGKFFTEMTKVSHGGTIKHISLSEIGDYVAYVPTSKDEREKIGSLFLNIDKTITLHQRKLDLLKEQKKGFLQKMFV